MFWQCCCVTLRCEQRGAQSQNLRNSKKNYFTWNLRHTNITLNWYFRQYGMALLLITARLPMEDYVFTDVCLSTGGGGVPKTDLHLGAGKGTEERVPQSGLQLWEVRKGGRMRGSGVPSQAYNQGEEEGYHLPAPSPSPDKKGLTMLRAVRFLRSHRRTFSCYCNFIFASPFLFELKENVQCT